MINSTTQKPGEVGATIDEDPYGVQGGQRESIDIKEIDAKFAGNLLHFYRIDHLKKYSERVMRHQTRDGESGSPKDFINENKSIMFQWNQYREARKYQVINES